MTPLTPTPTTETEMSVLKRELRKRLRAALRAIPDEQLEAESRAVTRRVAACADFQRARSVAAFVNMPHGELRTTYLLRACFDAGKRVFLPRVCGQRAHHMHMYEARTLDEVQRWPRNAWGIPEPPVVRRRRERELQRSDEVNGATECGGAGEGDDGVYGAARLQRGVDEVDGGECCCCSSSAGADDDDEAAAHEVLAGMVERERQPLDVIIVPGVGFDMDGGRIGHGKAYYDVFLRRCRAAHERVGLPPPRVVGVALACQIVHQVPMEAHDQRLDRLYTATQSATIPPLSSR